MRPLPILVLAVHAALLGPICAATTSLDAAAARKTILAGVTSVHGGVHPGRMVAFGPNACAIGYFPDAANGPLVAAATWGKGRVVAVPDHQMLDADKFAAHGDSARFFLNSIDWLTRSRPKTATILCTRRELAAWLRDQGFKNATPLRKLSDDLAKAQLLVGWLGSSRSNDDLQAIRTFVQRGGGLFLAEYGAGYDMWWKKPVHQAPANLLLRDAGIGFAAGHSFDKDLIKIQPAEGKPLQPADLLRMIGDHDRFSDREAAEGAAVLAHLSTALPPESPILTRLDQAVADRLGSINATPATPITHPFEKALLTREATQLADTPVDQVRPHRNAAALYGEIPDNAARVKQTVEISTDRSRWQPLGLYAPPGEVVALKFPATMVGKGYKVRVNAHTDNISRRPKWERPPVVHRNFPIDQELVRVANAFGGSLFIDVGKKPPGLGTQTILTSGAVEQPHFVLGKHSDADWNKRLRELPGSFAVLECERLIISLPSAQARDLSKPVRLMEWWDKVVALEDDLAAQAASRTSPELMNIDVQISAGAAHSGYPYQCYDKHWSNPADLDKLLANGSWGDFHELGHNHQRSHWWTFSGDGEVTVNFFSSYVLSTLNPDAKGGWAWVLDKDETHKRARKTWKSGTPYFEESSLANRLAFHMVLRHEFGWEPFKKVLASYEADARRDPDALPKNNNQEKIDQWLVRFSHAVGRDLTPYMRDRCGLPVSAAAAARVRHLPAWDLAG